MCATDGRAMRKTAWMTGAAGLLVLAGLAFVGSWLRRSPQLRCALDGARLDPLFRVRIVDEEGRSYEFCCVRCAEIWLHRQAMPPRAIYVTDEESGQEIDAASAYYVRSLVVTTAPTGNRIHAFRTRSDAERHASVFGGTLLGPSERPFGEGR
jgi:hypothetical protein